MIQSLCDYGHAGRFVQRLRQETAALPTVTVRQGTVKRLIGGAPHESARRLQCHGSRETPTLSARHSLIGASFW